MILDEMLVALGYEYDSEDMEAFRADLDDSVKLIQGLAAAATAGAIAIVGLVTATTLATDEQGKFAAQIGETVESLSALEFAQQRVGGDVGGLRSSLEGLNRLLGQAALGTGSAVEALSMLGLSATDADGRVFRASELIGQISERLQGVERSRQIDLADKLGLSGAMRLLQAGPEEIANLTREAEQFGVTTEKDAAIAAEFQDQLTGVTTIVKQIARLITQQAAPAITELTRLFTEWWKSNREIIEANLPLFLDKVVIALKLVSLALAGIIALRFVMHLAQMVTLLRAVSIGALAANAAFAVLPTLLVGVIAGIVGLMQDAKVFFDGGNSVFGDLIEKFPQWQTQLETTAKVFATMYDVTMMIWDGWKGIFKLFENVSIPDVVKALNFTNPVEALRSGARVVEPLSDLPGFIGSGVSNLFDNVFSGPGVTEAGTVSQISTVSGNPARDAVQNARDAQTSGIDNRTTNNINVSVATNANPQDIADAINRTIIEAANVQNGALDR